MDRMENELAGDANLRRLGRRRIWIRDVHPAVAPMAGSEELEAKGILGDPLLVTCDLVSDGHDLVAGEVRFRAEGGDWEIVALSMEYAGRWKAELPLRALGVCEFLIEAWLDRFGTWRTQTARKLEAGQDIAVDLLGGAELLTALAQGGPEAEARSLREVAQRLQDPQSPASARWTAMPSWVEGAARARADRSQATRTRTLRVRVDPPSARFSAWYELFPRDAGSGDRHGTFADVEALLPELHQMGFDVLYLPPIHPIGTTHRKGRNNTPTCQPGDPGSPWAIGDAGGGHLAVHSELGDLAGFRRLLHSAAQLGISVALDIAFQASPDHPWVREHPDWFRHRPDGSIQCAENPPKRYEDVYPLDFECDDYFGLWQALRDVFLFWAGQGVRVFRVDNPHTKPLPFWRWCLNEVKAREPDAIFLAEAFTRPGLMYSLAQVGFSQSYSYFTWRHTAEELTAYFTELTRPPVSEFFRPNLWPNTPDILPAELQSGLRPAFLIRLVLAATLSSSYGIYGPVFELLEHRRRDGTEEEYDHSEKYELRRFDRQRADSLKGDLTRLNRARRAHPALQDNRLTFHRCDNPNLLVYSKRDRTETDVVLVAVCLDPERPQSGHADLDLAALGLPSDKPFRLCNELADPALGPGPAQRLVCRGPRLDLSFDPAVGPAAVWHVQSKVPSENDFDYFA